MNCFTNIRENNGLFYIVVFIQKNYNITIIIDFILLKEEGYHMPREIQQLVNSPMLWMITLMSIALVLGMAAYFLVKSIKVAKSIGVT